MIADVLITLVRHLSEMIVCKRICTFRTHSKFWKRELVIHTQSSASHTGRQTGLLRSARHHFINTEYTQTLNFFEESLPAHQLQPADGIRQNHLAIKCTPGYTCIQTLCRCKMTFKIRLPASRTKNVKLTFNQPKTMELLIS